jgi:predicted metal-dependent RNase
LNGVRREVTMKLLKKDWFVVSGYAGEKVFYQKTMLKDGVFKTFIIEYDRAQKSFYDPVTARIARSFAG